MRTAHSGLPDTEIDTVKLKEQEWDSITVWIVWWNFFFLFCSFSLFITALFVRFALQLSLPHCRFAALHFQSLCLLSKRFLLSFYGSTRAFVDFFAEAIHVFNISPNNTTTKQFNCFLLLRRSPNWCTKARHSSLIFIYFIFCHSCFGIFRLPKRNLKHHLNIKFKSMLLYLWQRRSEETNIHIYIVSRSVWDHLLLLCGLCIPACFFFHLCSFT